MHSQTRAELESQRSKIQNEIKETGILLGQNQATQKDLLERIEDLTSTREIQKELIVNLNKELLLIKKEIQQNKSNIRAQEAELEGLKKEYSDMIYQAYKSRSKQSKLLFILSSEDFNQAFKRLEYLSQFTDFRQEQAELIVEKKKTFDAALVQLEVDEREQSSLLKFSKIEQQKLNKDQLELNSLKDEVLEKERFYKRQIKAKQKEEDKIEEEIKELILKAIAASKPKVPKEKKPKADAYTGFALSPSAVALEKDFEGNKGKLPWPVDRYVITRKFGTQSHPTLVGIKIKSNGIRLATVENSKAKSVFSGTVLAIQVQKGGKKTVLIQHGNYITIYKNLYNLRVSKGMDLTTGQELGTIFTDKVSGKTTLGFVLMKQVSQQNPQSWLLSNK
jgi:septal ring factor EnvC (AmiA/AmiB activator)